MKVSSYPNDVAANAESPPPMIVVASSKLAKLQMLSVPLAYY